MSDQTTTMLGKLAPDHAQRDAIHVAVAPMVAAHVLAPGEWVALNENGEAIQAFRGQPAIGIVDPFLPANERVMRGQRFWLFLKPGTVTGMRHAWEHPAFTEKINASESETSDCAKLFSRGWLSQYADRWRIPLDRLIEEIQEGEVCFGTDIDYPHEIPDEFWEHYTVLTGKPKPTKEIAFHCAC